MKDNRYRTNNMNSKERIWNAEQLLERLCEEVSFRGGPSYTHNSEACLEPRHVEDWKDQVMIAFRRDDAAIVLETMAAQDFEMWDADACNDRVPLFILHGQESPFLMILLKTLFHKNQMDL